MVVDAQMIAQLCETQDLEDKKQIGVFGMRTNKELVSDQSPDVLRVDKNCLQCSGNMS
jgi:hypothetical protein